MNSYGIVGVLIYAITFVIDRMLINLPDYLYIPFILLALIFLIIGYKRNKKRLITISPSLSQYLIY